MRVSLLSMRGSLCMLECRPLASPPPIAFCLGLAAFVLHVPNRRTHITATPLPSEEAAICAFSFSSLHVVPLCFLGRCASVRRLSFTSVLFFFAPSSTSEDALRFSFFSVEREKGLPFSRSLFAPALRKTHRNVRFFFFCSLMYWYACVRGVFVSVSFSFLCVWVGGGGDLCFHNSTDRRTPLDLAKGMREKNDEPTERCVKVGRVPVGTRREKAHPYVHRGRRLLQLAVPGRGLECCLSLSWCASRFYRI